MIGRQPDAQQKLCYTYLSVLSKARTRWGADVFQYFFERIVWQCLDAGLIDGSKMVTDA